LTVALTTGQHYRAACDPTVLPATHTQITPAFTSQLKGVPDFWLVLIAPSHRGKRNEKKKKNLFVKFCNNNNNNKKIH